ncbi:hypothetical protein N2152v2_008194 [Parachlorella kessleri]
MTERTGQPNWLQLSSFDAQSFFAAQQQQRDKQQQAQAAHLQAAADYLLPSSTDEESDSASEAGGSQDSGRSTGVATGAGKEEGSQAREPGSPDGSRSRRAKRKRHKKERRRTEGKHKRHRSDKEKVVRAERLGGESQRLRQVKGWAASDSAASEPFYFDARGDPGNVAFGGLYRADIAAYRRHDPAGYALLMGAKRREYGTFRGALPSEADGHALARERDLRYYGAALLRLEHSTRLRRWHRWQHARGGPAQRAQREQAPAQQAPAGAPLRSKLDLPATNFLPLVAAPEEEDDTVMRQPAGPGAVRGAVGEAAGASSGQQEGQQRQHAGETREEWVLRWTRQLNAATRERPYDLQLWLDFAQFQVNKEEAVRAGGHGLRRGAAGERAVAEKKVAILERALVHHPGSDRLLLALLEAARPLCTEPEMEARWRRILARHGGSPQLWKRYLLYRRSQFAGFNVGEVAGLYLEALQALHRERLRRIKEGAPADVVAGVESEMASLALDWCSLRLQSGHTETAVAGIQALLEWHLFAPEGWGQAAKRDMFQDYWESGDPLVGELGGGRGWAGWLAGTTAPDVGVTAERGRGRNRQGREAEQAGAEEEQGPSEDAAWSGWVDLAPAAKEEDEEKTGQEAGQGEGESEAGSGPDGLDAEDGSEGEVEEEGDAAETEEELLQRLGVNLDAALEQAASLTPDVLSAWLGTEAQRDAAQWQPWRGKSPGGLLAEGGEGEGDGDGATAAGEEARVPFRGIAPLLQPLESEAAVRQLVLGCLLLLGAPLLGMLGSSDPAAAAGGAAMAADELWQVGWVGELAATAADPTTSLDQGKEPLAWLLAGPSGGHSGTRDTPWYQAHLSRHQFLLRLLAALVQGPCKQWPLLARALLLVASQTLQPALPAPTASQPSVAPPASATEGKTGGGGGGEKLSLVVRWEWGDGRALAKQLLSEQRESLLLWRAYAELEGQAGKFKAARKVFQTCFATVAASPTWPKAKQAAPLVLSAALLEVRGAATSATAAAGAAAARGGEQGSQAVAALQPLSGSAAAALAAQAAFGASQEAAVPAARLLGWLGAGGAVPWKAAEGGVAQAGGGMLTAEQVVMARKGFQGLLFSVLEQGRAAFDPGSCDLVACAAAFELLEPLASRGPGAAGAGVRAALAIYEQVLTALQGSANTQAPTQQAQQQDSTPTLARAAGENAAIEGLCQWRGALLAEASRRGLPSVPPKLVRAALLKYLNWFPASQALLQMLLRHEAAGHRMAQLRRDCRQLCTQHPTLQAWLAVLAVELLSHSAPAALAGVLERAVSSEALRHCPLLWRCYARLEASRQRPTAVRRVFLRGVGACPWDKALWLDGMALLNGSAPPQELGEYLDIVKDKDLLIRTDVYEVLLAQLEGTLAE